MKYFILFILFSVTTFGQSDSLKTGDLIFQNIDCGEMCEAINAVTEGFEGNDFNHMGMVIKQNDKIFVLEASGEEVKLTSWEKFAKYTEKPMFVGRLLPEYQHLIDQAVTFGLQQIGMPYDNDFLYDNGKYYCSELIYDCFLAANNDQPFFKLFPMTYKAPGSEDFFPVWITHFTTQNIDIPEGKPGCNPGGISLDEKIMVSELNFKLPSF